MIIEYYEQDKRKEIKQEGTIKGYRVGYDRDNEFSWVVISMSMTLPIVLGCFHSQDDMEYLMGEVLIKS